MVPAAFAAKFVFVIFSKTDTSMEIIFGTLKHTPDVDFGEFFA
jgi:hypothetical protein